MNAAQAMGTFLRTWRAEWAGLSQTQLAMAVSARRPKAKPVTRDVVREWEQGQPPHSTAELEALLAVMQRHGITEWEADDFRQAVFAACSSRQYPELFPDESIAHREDVDELAAAAVGSIVALVTRTYELQEAEIGRASCRERV